MSSYLSSMFSMLPRKVQCSTLCLSCWRLHWQSIRAWLHLNSALLIILRLFSSWSTRFSRQFSSVDPYLPSNRFLKISSCLEFILCWAICWFVARSISVCKLSISILKDSKSLSLVSLYEKTYEIVLKVIIRLTLKESKIFFLESPSSWNISPIIDKSDFSKLL